MNKIIFLIFFVFQALFAFGQMTESEKRSVDSLLQTGKLTSNQLVEVQKKLNSSNLFKVNKDNGEMEISEIVTLTGLDKKIIYQRCLEWIAINFGSLVHNDLESGKIIANGNFDLKNFEGSQSAFGGTKINQSFTPTSYTMILTIKDNKIKYIITNIYYSFIANTETGEVVTLPLSTVYSSKDISNKIKYLTVLNASYDMFYNSLKTSLAKYINDSANDYSF